MKEEKTRICPNERKKNLPKKKENKEKLPKTNENKKRNSSKKERLT